MGTAMKLRKAVTLIMSTNAPDWNTSLLKEIPTKWTIHGDCALLPPTSFSSSKIWDQYPQVYQEVARILKVNTIARQNGPIKNPNYRQPSVSILFGSSSSSSSPIVQKKENGIWYSWDITKVMFSAGNISEKQRLARLDLKDKIVVDLYAGIGYFSLTFLIHCGAQFLYACEWNPDALYWLEANLTNPKNKVDPKKYIILQGDNRLTAPKGVADHVNLGLIPSSEASWQVAAAALKKDTGGFLHVHGNVDIVVDKEEEVLLLYDDDSRIEESPLSSISSSWKKWSKHVESSISKIFLKLYPDEKVWNVEVVEVVKVKSYGPKVHHLVADVYCKPS